MQRGVEGLFKDIGGQKFGRLLAIGRVGLTRQGQAIWLCKCDCGNFSRVRISSLTTGNTRSCGCLQKERVGEAGRRKRGKDRYNWKGDDAGYSGVHRWLQRNKPKPKLCERCGERPVFHLSFNGKGMEWSRNPDDYEWLCVSCHGFKDKGQGTIMTEEKVVRVKGLYSAGGWSQEKLGRLFGVSRATIRRILGIMTP